MRSMQVTCPETAHLETLELEDHPLGILIAGCSRCELGRELGCTRRCAALLDRRARSRGEPDKPDEPALASLEVGDQTRFDLDLDLAFAARRTS